MPASPPHEAIRSTSSPPSLHDAESLLSEDLVHEEELSATVLSSSINLANTILGSGMLAMPAAIAAVGLLPGTFLVGLSACASAMGLYLLSRCAALTSPSPERSASFSGVAASTYPRASIAINLAIAIKCFGVGISYLIIIGDLMPEVFRGFGVVLEGGILPWADRRLWITLFMIIIVPLTCLRRLDSLKYTSIAALGAVVYLWMIVVIHYIDPARPPPPKPIELIHWGSSGLITHLPVFVFAFTCHQNIFSVYNEIRDNDQPQLNSVIQRAIGSGYGIYMTIGTLGYLTFGPTVLPNVILMYDSGLIITIGRASLVLLQLFSFPLQAHPCRACLSAILPSPSGSSSPPVRAPLSLDSAPEETPVEDPWSDDEGEGDAEADDQHPVSAPARRKRDAQRAKTTDVRFIVLTALILCASYLVAITVSELDLVLAFVGSTGSTTISFILPGIFFLRLTRGRHGWRRWVARVLVVYGSAVMIVCLSANLRRVFGGGDPSDAPIGH